jgi:NADH dehydrogenase (ubiquinone) 1 alpha subcomplex subunit 9
LKYSDTVYNLVGRDWETRWGLRRGLTDDRNFNYHQANVASAQLIASVAAEHGTPRLVHVSHLNASPDSASIFYQSKHASERAVRDAFPEATIVRPAGMYGAEDWLLNAMARE